VLWKTELYCVIATGVGVFGVFVWGNGLVLVRVWGGVGGAGDRSVWGLWRWGGGGAPAPAPTGSQTQSDPLTMCVKKPETC
jgi:hypothetical protein